MRRLPIALAALALAAPIVTVAPANADPGCLGTAYGVDHSGRLIAQQVANYDDDDAELRVLGDLGFTPSTMAFTQQDFADADLPSSFVATAADGVARRVTVRSTYDPWSSQATVTSDPVRSITPKALAYGQGTPAYLYTVSATGNLWRYDARSTGPVFGHGVHLRAGLGNVRALVVHKRVSVGGRATDVLLATTSYGRLFEVLVPVRRPHQLRTIRLAASGFAAYDGLTAANEYSCGLDEDDWHGFLAVDLDDETARWYYLGRDRVPTAADLQVGPEAVGSWRLDRVF